VKLFPDGGASLVDSKTAPVVMTSVALLVVSEPMKVDAYVHACNSAMLEIVERDVVDVTEPLSAAASSSILPSSESVPAVAVQSTKSILTHIPSD